jgi:dolichol-phosphate mannosyltransferase
MDLRRGDGAESREWSSVDLNPYQCDGGQSDPADGIPQLSLIIPTYNERENVTPLMARLETALHDVRWEAIFVDDDSPDGTAAGVRDLAVKDDRIRLLHRVGKRGLASACIDGMGMARAPFIAVMDADLQHDERILPMMLRRLRDEQLDVVVGTRNADGGSMGEFAIGRVLLSSVGRRIGHAVCRTRLSDPMSGFFLVRRSFVEELLPRLQRSGFKILVDILATSRRPARVGEVGYTFGQRQFGESKLDVSVGVEYLSLVCSKMAGNIVPVRTGLFFLVGSVGVVIHMSVLALLMRHEHMTFLKAHTLATFCAMLGNYIFNNSITFRDRRLRGWRMAGGLMRFVLACSIAAWVNIAFAHRLWHDGVSSYAAGLAGIVLGSIWNLTVSSYLTWGAPGTVALPAEEETSFPPDLEVAR